VAKPLTGETIRWEAYPSWSHFSWLYFFSLMTGFRGFLGLRMGISGWEMWKGGAIVLLVCVGLLRRWAHYMVTSHRLIIENGFTGRIIQELPIHAISEISLTQGPLAHFFQIGTLVIRSSNDDQLLFLQGVSNPEVIKTRIEAMRSISPHSS